MGQQNLRVTVVEILSLVPGRINSDAKDGSFEDEPVGIMAVRLAPEYRWDAENLAITRSQLVRLRNDIDALLGHPESWLYLPSDEQSNGEA